MHSRHHGVLLGAIFLKVARWFDSGTERARRSEIENLLSQAANVADLEARILGLQSGPSFLPFPEVRDVSQAQLNVRATEACE